MIHVAMKLIENLRLPRVVIIPLGILAAMASMVGFWFLYALGRSQPGAHGAYDVSPGVEQYIVLVIVGVALLLLLAMGCLMVATGLKRPRIV